VRQVRTGEAVEGAEGSAVPEAAKFGDGLSELAEAAEKFHRVKAGSGGELGLVAKAEFAGGFRGAFIGAEEDDFDFGVEAHPGLDGVALDDGDVAVESLGNGEEGQHIVRVAKKEGMCYIPR